uniref:Uncharacterized protein n=1 Tax=Cacopsylla melanoneura TaxID=428564 RepID=A0A8D9E963_9HEMI
MPSAFSKVFLRGTFLDRFCTNRFFYTNNTYNMGVLEFKSPPIRIYIIIYYPGSTPGILVVSCIRYKFHFFPIGTYTTKKNKRLVVHWKRELEKIFYHGEIALQGT